MTTKPRKSRDLSDFVSLDPVPRLQREFTVVKELGAGAFGKATLVIDNATRRHMVVKSLKQRLDQITTREAVSEVQSLRMLRHTNVVALHDAWVDVDEHLHMLMEYCDGGDLQEYLSRNSPLPTQLIVSFFAQLLIAMDYLHTKHVLHRDIKCSNILICRSTLTLKIGDFGLSKCMNGTDDAAQTRLGTPFYMSPELVASKNYTRKTDIWSLGIAFYQLLTNRVPFHAKNMPDLMRMILSAQPTHPTASTQYPDDLGELVMRMLTKDKKLRPTARELLSSPCLKDVMTQCPWQREFAGMRSMFVCRSNALVNLRSEPSAKSDRLGNGLQLTYGDPIVVEGDVIGADGVIWYKIKSPVDGYCISEQYGKQLFQLLGETDRQSPIDVPPEARGLPSVAKHRNSAAGAAPPGGASPAKVSPIRRTTPLRAAAAAHQQQPPQPPPSPRPTTPARLTPLRHAPLTPTPRLSTPRMSPLRVVGAPANRSPLRKG